MLYLLNPKFVILLLVIGFGLAWIWPQLSFELSDGRFLMAIGRLTGLSGKGTSTVDKVGGIGIL